jgi:Tfp pilus assembly protein PilF
MIAGNKIDEKEEEERSIVSAEKRHLNFDGLLSGSVVSFNLDKIDGIKKLDDAPSLFSVQEAGKEKELNLYTQTKNSLESFVAENSDLAQDNRFCDTYNYRVSSFYRSLGDYQNEREFLTRIRNTANPFYREKIAENQLRTRDTAEEGLKTLDGFETEDSALYRAAYYYDENDYDKSLSILRAYHDAKGCTCSVNGAIAGICITSLHDYRAALHYLRESFYVCRESSETALMISVLYRLLCIGNFRLLEKSRIWAQTAFALDSSDKYALSMIVHLFIKNRPAYVESKIDTYLERPSAQKSKFYTRARILKAQCRFVIGKYGDALATLQELTGTEEYAGAVWNNIALCNLKIGSQERALRNMAKALEKSVQKNDREQVAENYIRMLADAQRYREASDLYEKTGFTTCPRTRDEYLDRFSVYLRTLKNQSRMKEYAELLQNVFENAESPAVKNCAAIDTIRFCYISGTISGTVCRKTADFIVEQCLNGQSLAENLNDAVFVLLEQNRNIPAPLLARFTNYIRKDPYYAATWGLYQFRVKNNAGKGAEYYSAAMQLAKDSALYEELTYKCHYELARNYLQNGNTRAAGKEVEALIKKCPDSLFWYRTAAQRLTAGKIP